MYFWNYRKLAEALRNGVVSKDSYLGYKLLFFVTLASELAFTFYASEPMESALESILKSTFYLLFSVGICFYINRKGDNLDLRKRFFCLYWPIYVRTFVVSIALYASILGYAFVLCEKAQGEVKGMCISSIFENDKMWLSSILPIFYSFYLFIQSFRIASGKEVAA